MPGWSEQREQIDRYQSQTESVIIKLISWPTSTGMWLAWLIAVRRTPLGNGIYSTILVQYHPTVYDDQSNAPPENDWESQDHKRALGYFQYSEKIRGPRRGPRIEGCTNSDFARFNLGYATKVGNSD